MEPDEDPNQRESELTPKNRQSSPLLRMGCGMLVGLLGGLLLAFTLAVDVWSFNAILFTTAIVAGLFAFRYGDRALMAMLDAILEIV